MGAAPNAVIGASGYGAVFVNAEVLDFGIDISTEIDGARNRAVLYPRHVSNGTFTVGLIFGRWSAYNTFGNWMRAYGVRAQNPDLGVGPMRIIVPSRHFDRLGMPESGVTIGDDYRQVVYRMSIDFQEATDPTSLTSTFALPRDDRENAPFFYPGGIQLGAGQSADAYLYKQPTPLNAPKLGSDYQWPHGGSRVF